MFLIKSVDGLRFDNPLTSPNSAPHMRCFYLLQISSVRLKCHSISFYLFEMTEMTMDESYRYTDHNRREYVPEGKTTGADRIACLSHRQDIFRMFCSGSDLSHRMITEKR